MIMRFLLIILLLLLTSVVVETSAEDKGFLRATNTPESTTTTTNDTDDSLHNSSSKQRKALSKVVLATIRSPNHVVDEEALQEALDLGIPKETIMKAVNLGLAKHDNMKLQDPRTVTLKDDNGGGGLSSTVMEEAAATTTSDATSATSSTAATPPSEQQLSNTSSSSNKQQKKPNRRKFVSYQSSEWEELWLNNVDLWSSQKEICQQLLSVQQKEYLFLYLKMICTTDLGNDWCTIDDGTYQLWYRSPAGDNPDKPPFLSWENPSSQEEQKQQQIPPTKPKAVKPTAAYERVASKFVFLDEVTGEEYIEYIEPLVSHLRFPLSYCLSNDDEGNKYQQHNFQFKGYIIPPPPVVRGNEGSRAILYDTGSTNFDKDLKDLYGMWERHGIKWDDVFSYSLGVKNQEELKVPQERQAHFHLTSTTLSTDPEQNSPSFPFLPTIMKEQNDENDYIAFKLDVDKPVVEQRLIEYILNDSTDYIDELFWEHHILGNYLVMEENVPRQDLTLRQSYEYFLRLRQKGIRAHSWV